MTDTAQPDPDRPAPADRPAPPGGPEAMLAALADPTRRAIVGRLRPGALSVGALADGLPVSRPAVSQHLRVLTDAGLLHMHRAGTRRLYQLSPGGVQALRAYLDGLWDDALAGFAAAAHDASKNKED
ncbi:ArsR/SmtB family transcription factor [Marinibacterium sp. SX1]|uniref:ArsR/SmtB family transcription factor n=1 Tax=Marinibacterium sp. SX1 TaxID=3388424 RepID=UPI003D1647A9